MVNPQLIRMVCFLLARQSLVLVARCLLVAKLKWFSVVVLRQRIAMVLRARQVTRRQSYVYTSGSVAASTIEFKVNTPTGQHEDDGRFGSARSLGAKIINS